MKSRKIGAIYAIICIICAALWLFVDWNWESVAIGCVKIVLLIFISFGSAELGTCPYCNKVGVPVFLPRKKYAYCSKCGKRITYY